MANIKGLSSELTAQDFTEQRNEAMREGVKSLFWMNGGGAVALLAFLHAIWHKEPTLMNFVVCGLFILVLGVALAGLVHFLRTYTSEYTQRFYLVDQNALDTNVLKSLLASIKVSQRLYLTCAYLSLVCFIIGVGIVLYGTVLSIPEHQETVKLPELPGH